ncbi:MAG: TetR/AcrR family transcriptional regulator [Minwuia sp.]|uniref:TetR/AcrR family transcriptional regulator n=1 Tax=Minwuia sp. TaxID=2493630 RepID=UPI003A84FC07
MSWSKKSRSRKGYHHGNLREALVDAALSLISEKGLGGFSFAEAARAAGVSPAAPYRHFRDRDALLADVAQRGFEALAERLDEAWDDGRPEPVKAFDALGRAYLDFAREEPAYYVAMFESQLAPADYPEMNRAGDAAFGVLRRAAEAVAATMPEGRRPPAMMVALHMWSMAHGIASLFGRGDPGRRPLPMSAEALLEAATLVYFQGLRDDGRGPT